MSLKYIIYLFLFITFFTDLVSENIVDTIEALEEKSLATRRPIND